MALGISATKFFAAQATYSQGNRAASVPFETYDVLLSPTLAQPPIKLGTLDQNAKGLGSAEWTRRVFEWCAFTPLFNSIATITQANLFYLNLTFITIAGGWEFPMPSLLCRS